MSLRKFERRWSNKLGFGSVNKLQFSKGYYVVRFKNLPGGGSVGMSCEANNLRIAKKKADQCKRGEL